MSLWGESILVINGDYGQSNLVNLDVFITLFFAFFIFVDEDISSLCTAEDTPLCK